MIQNLVRSSLVAMASTRNRSVLGIAGLSVCILLYLGRLGGAAEAPAAKPVKVILPIGSVSASYMPRVIAKRKGFFQEEGFDVDIVRIMGRILVPGMTGGSFVYSAIGSAAEIAAIMRGAELRFLFVGTQKTPFELIARPGIHNIKDLRGKTFGSGSFVGSQPDEAARKVLRFHGVDPKEVKFLLLGATQERFTALASGNVDATLLTAEVSLQALQKGFVKLVDAGDFARAISASILTTDQRTRERPEEVGRFVRAVLKGHRFYMARKNETVQMMMEFFGYKERGFAEGVYEAYRGGMTQDGTVSDDELLEAIDQAKALLKGASEAREWKPGDFFDFGFLKKAREELTRMKWGP
jgi:NitT/TauT family transport system substrate-binding protein